jgi:hypothetical protein
MPDMNQPMEVEPSLPLPVTLTAQQWNQIINILTDAPYRIAAPLLATIVRQTQSGATTALTRNGNGQVGDHHHADQS